MADIYSKLIRGTAVYAIGNFGSKILLFALVPIVSFFLTKEELGEYDLVQTAMNLLIPIFSAQIFNGTYRWLLEKKTKTPPQTVILNGLTICVVGLLLFSILYFITSEFIPLSISFVTGLLLLGSSMFFQYFQFVARGLGKSRLFSYSGILYSFILVISTFLLLKIFAVGVEGLYWSIIAANLVGSVFLFFTSKIYLYTKIASYDLTTLKEMLHFSLPLIPNQISWWLITASDKFLILKILSADMNGIYAISSRFPAIMTIINSIFLLAWQDFTIKDDGQDVRVNTRLFNTYMRVQFGMVLLLAPLSELTVKFLVDAKFYEAYKYMPILYLGVAYSAMAGYFGAIYLKSRNTIGVFTTSIVGGIVNILITFLLMKNVGLYASAIGTFVSFFLIVLIRILQTKKVMPIKVPFPEMLFFTILSLSLSFFVVHFDVRVNLLIFLFTSILVFYFNKNIFIKIKNRIVK
ncbi:lipopolysaccharide biosynthesis protein [Sphingobacterium humi]|uniref:Oligosaccharide flippase family protein n=1 Tax=Sphingobacterium humi TaxID=1796905 RepID=A0A6N8L7D7_9SPHI|nr:lipopolysaccharide biosynthesis protein [Sphingobacterium humi]MVZ63642.1 oligosaccharide flippase family protein [Sphingobacterium humi]